MQGKKKRDISAIHKYIDAHFNESIEEIRRFLRQPGFSYTGEGIRENMKFVVDFLCEWTFMGTLFYPANKGRENHLGEKNFGKGGKK